MRTIHTLDDLIHELTNSLGLMSSYAQWLGSKPSVDPKAAKGLKMIQEEAERAANLLELVPYDTRRLPTQNAESFDRRTVTPRRQPAKGGGRAE